MSDGQKAHDGDREDQATIELSTDKRRRPVLHVLRYDGDRSVFRQMEIAIPETDPDNDNNTVYCLLINSKGEPFVDDKGEYIIRPAPPLQLGPYVDPNKLLSREDIVKGTGLSRSTIKREEKRGNLGKPVAISPRRVAFTTAQVQEWMERSKPHAKRWPR